MNVKVFNVEMIDTEYRKYIFKKNIYKCLLDMNYISLEEYEKSIVQLKEKYISKK